MKNIKWFIVICLIFGSCENRTCEDDCSQIEEPVCVEDNGTIITFMNACYADCAGYTEDRFISCNTNDCEISAINVVVGECNNDGTYALTIDFQYANPGNQYFDLYVRNNQHIGYYLLSDLPLTIPNFALSGSNEDYLKVCINDRPDCCKETEWIAPDCNTNDCEISAVNVVVGECNNDGTYALTIDFQYANPGNQYFDLYVRNNQHIGYYLLSDLPLTIPNFALSGSNEDYLKVCINDRPDCCKATEWIAPDCT